MYFTEQHNSNPNDLAGYDGYIFFFWKRND
jgi:hypothetical protein